jgi:hypothetical protein
MHRTERVRYSWAVEEYCSVDGEIFDTSYWDTPAEALAMHRRVPGSRVVLVREVWDTETENLQERAYAHVDATGALAPYFDNGDRVPMHCHRAWHDATR